MSFFRPATTLPLVTYGVRSADYHRLGDKPRGHREFIMSRSSLMLFAKNPQGWRDGKEVKETDATAWGSLIDCMVLTPDQTASQYIVSPETYLAEDGKPKPWNLNAKVCKAWEAEQCAKGLSSLKVDTFEEARIAVAKLQRDKRVGAVLANCSTQVQVCVEYADPETGIVVPLKLLIDIVPKQDRSLLDFKTARSADPRDWRKAVFEREYHVQSAMYLDGYNAATGEKRDTFRHIVQENSCPYAVARRTMSDEYLQLGRAAYRNALLLYCQCLAADSWPGYDDLDDGLNGDVIDGWRTVEPMPWMVMA